MLSYVKGEIKHTLICYSDDPNASIFFAQNVFFSPKYSIRLRYLTDLKSELEE